jgi:hypothetical protein
MATLRMLALVIGDDCELCGVTPTTTKLVVSQCLRATLIGIERQLFRLTVLLLIRFTHCVMVLVAGLVFLHALVIFDLVVNRQGALTSREQMICLKITITGIGWL